jgi:hypothetical protein
MKGLNIAAAGLGYALVIGLAAHIAWIHWECRVRA